MGNPRQPKTVKLALISINVRIREDLYQEMNQTIATINCNSTEGCTKRAFIEEAIRQHIARCKEGK
jgi:hypothetical protein